MNPTTNQRLDANTTLFEHTARPDWGLAILAWEHDDKRGFQFQDGQLRIFKAGFFDLLRPVDRPIDESVRVLAEIGKAVGRERAAKRISDATTPIPLTDQIAYFTSLFPKGFQGMRWAKQHRGIDAGKQLKRHRNPVIQDAADLLAPQRLEAHLDGGLAEVVVDRLRALVDSTDLVSKAAARGMERIESAAAESIVRALANLLTDGSDLGTTFEAWVAALTRALGREPTWELATAVPALARPDRFTAVKRTTFTYAAAWLAPNVIVGVTPTGDVYQRLLDMTSTLATKLGEAGLRPRDRMDVYDFIQVTLCPKAVKAIQAIAKGDTRDRPTRHVAA